MIYQWKEGSRAKGDPQVAGEICAKLEAEGRLSAQVLVDVSRPEDAPLHDSFEWDDFAAAESWRREQARYIIRTVVVKEENKAPQQVFYNISTERGNYHHINTIVKQRDRYEQLLRDALSEARSFRNKYNTLSEMKPMMDAIDTVLESQEKGCAANA